MFRFLNGTIPYKTCCRKPQFYILYVSTHSEGIKSYSFIFHSEGMKIQTAISCLRKCYNCDSQHPSNYQRCSCPKKELQRRILNNAGPGAPSGRHFKNYFSRESLAAAADNSVLEPPLTGIRRLSNTAEQVPGNALTAMWLN
jgi:hypothetical protein